VFAIAFDRMVKVMQKQTKIICHIGDGVGGGGGGVVTRAIVPPNP